ncbi:hypothetical protein Tco_1052321 [Tanacetum coccineum]
MSKLLLEAIKKRFGRNEATKKTQRNLLKQQYENFTALSSEMLDQTFDRLQKLVSQLDLLGEKLSQEDVNQKLLRSLSPEWNTYAVMWRNKADLETMCMDDLYKTSSPPNEAVNAALGSYSAPRNQDNKKERLKDGIDVLHVETSTSLALVSYEFVNKPVVENSKAMSSEEEPKALRKNDVAPIIEEWVLDSEEENVSQTKTKKKTVKPSIAKIEFVKPKQQEKTARKTVKQVEKHRQNIHSPSGNKKN